MNFTDMKVEGTNVININDAFNSLVLQLKIKPNENTTIPTNNELIIYVDKSEVTSQDRKQIVFELSDSLKYLNNSDLSSTNNEPQADEFIIESKMVGNTVGYGSVGPQDTWSLSERYNNPDHNLVGRKVGQDMGIKQGAYNNRWVKDYSTCLAKELNGQILAKHQGMQLPGGITVDGVRLIEEARIEKEALREELYMLDPPAPILVG